MDKEEFRSREPELAALGDLLREASGGRGGAIVVRGEAGIGKTALLEKALDTAPDLRTVRGGGPRLAYGTLHELCEPLMAHAASLPAPQRDALETAFALRDGPPPDLSRLGFAVRGLLADAASERPIACLIDDAHLLDRASAEVVAFAARRAGTAPLAFLLAGREHPGLRPFTGLPSRRLTGLGHEDAVALLTSRLRAPLDRRIRDQIVAEARGNPRTLLDMRREAGSAELAGGYGLPAAASSPARVDDRYRDRVAPLPARTRRLLLVAAAEPLGEPALLWDAARRLGIGTDAAAPAEAAGLLDLGTRVRFEHPGLRRSVYRAAAPDERRAVHRALAEAADPRTDPDRRAWHRARAALVPDEAVAAALERAAPDARTRGGLAAAGAFLERAAALSPDPARRAARALAAARLELRAGALERAHGLLGTATAGPLDAPGRARARLLSAQLKTHTGRCADAVAPLLDAAAELGAHDRPAARDACLDAVDTALAAGRFGERPLARAARAGADHGRGERPADLLLDALGIQVTEGDVAAGPALRAAVDAVAGLPEEPADLGSRLVCGAAADLWDDKAWGTLAERHLRAARRTGARTAVPLALRQLALVRIHTGEFDAAAALIAQAHAAADPARVCGADLMLTAWRGDVDRLGRLTEAATRSAHARGRGRLLSVIDHATAVLHNGAGRYETALRAARRAARYDDPGLHAFVPSELVEAAVRAGRPHLAEPVLERLIERTRASGTDWARGIGLRSRALLTGAEDLYRAAIHHLERASAVPQLARTHLLYGEWLRREHRRGDARTHLRSAHETLTSIGAAGFAARAARELAACGDRPPKPGTTPLGRLTPQETLVARLVAEGATSKEAARQLFLSPRTVEAHLRSIFRKLGLTSRRQLRDLDYAARTFIDTPGIDTPGIDTPGSAQACGRTEDSAASRR